MARGEGNKREEIIGLLREAILSGRLRPGTRLAEMRLGRELGVSQAIVREALHHLESLGLVVRQPGQGTYVIELDADDLLHIYQVRMELESLVCGLVAGRIDAEILSRLQNGIADMHAAEACRDFLAYSSADIHFHRILWSSQPNRYLEKSLETLCLPLFAYDRIQRATVSGMDFERVTRQHEMIVRALSTGDADLASRLMRRMMRQWLQVHLAEYDRIRQFAEQSPQEDTDPYEVFRQND